MNQQMQAFFQMQQAFVFKSQQPFINAQQNDENKNEDEDEDEEEEYDDTTIVDDF